MTDLLIAEVKRLLQKPDLVAAEVTFGKLQQQLRQEPAEVRWQYRTAKIQLQQELARLRNLVTLQLANRQLHESIAIGDETTHLLNAQHRQVVNTRSRLQELQEELSWSNKLLTRMSRWWRG